MNNFKKCFYIGAAALAITACRNNDEAISTTEWATGDKGNVTLSFSNEYNNSPLALGDTGTTLTSSNGQKHRFNELKYVVSNVVLTDEKGNTYKYYYNDKSMKGAHIINQADATTYNFKLSDIPAGNYTKITFGLGLHKDINELKEEDHPTFYATMGKIEMKWAWAKTYRFAKFEGQYGDNLDNDFSVHTGSIDIGKKDKPEEWKFTDAYREISLDLGSTLKVRQSSANNIAIKADINQFLSGKNAIIFESGKNTSIHNLDQMPTFADAIAGMFSVKSVQ
ncbi:MAG: hypothetical protein Q4C75_07010 [Bergeyella zoohelcum]|nr:hypothetical protein [Bergeyella zoohelcum]